MKKMNKVVLLLMMAVTAATTAAAQATKLHQLFEDYQQEYQQLFPLDATFAGDHRYDDQLPNDISAPFLEKEHSFYEKYLQALHTIQRSSLNTADRISYDVLQEMLETGLEKKALHLEYMPVNQFTSTPALIGQLGTGTSAQPFNTVKDYDNWLNRLTAFVPWIDTCIANFNKGIQTGLVLPKILVIKTIPQMAALATTDTAKNVFYQPLKHLPDSFATADKQRITQDYQQVLTQQLLPAFKRLADYLQNTYLPAATDSAGLSALPGGAAIYRYYIRFHATTDESPESIYQTGLREVARITQRMEALKAQTGFKGTLQEFFHYLRTDPKFTPFTTPEQVLDAYRRIYEKIQPHLPALFELYPKTPFEIRRFEAFREASQAGPAYVLGSADATRPGVFYVPVPDATKVNVTFYGLEVNFIHEAIPGHHFQISLQQENKSMPAFRRQPSFKGFVEGWALYCESLGPLLGCYTDPYQQMGALNNEMHRAIRLVVDVGIHTGKMSREQAIAYMMAHEPVSESIAIAEIERYMAFPAQALTYKIGELKIQALRKKYERQLGPAFNLRSFHTALLQQGDMPLTVLESYLDEWAAGQTKKHQ